MLADEGGHLVELRASEAALVEEVSPDLPRET